MESARWLVLTKKPEEAVQNLKTVARVNGRQAEGDKINLEVKRDKVAMLVEIFFVVMFLFDTSGFAGIIKRIFICALI